jgi:hypothetical protein
VADGDVRIQASVGGVYDHVAPRVAGTDDQDTVALDVTHVAIAAGVQLLPGELPLVPRDVRVG